MNIGVFTFVKALTFIGKNYSTTISRRLGRLYVVITALVKNGAAHAQCLFLCEPQVTCCLAVLGLIC